MLSKEKPTLVLSDHPPLQRMLPVLREFFLGGNGFVVSDHSMKIVAEFFGIGFIPVYRDPSKIETYSTGEYYKQKILSVLGKITNSQPKYEHQGKAVTDQVLAVLQYNDVFIAPAGVTNKVSPWKPGVSHILTEAGTKQQDFALSFVYIPDSFREKFSVALFESWTQVLDSEAVEWTDNHRQNAKSLQTYYESLRTTK